MPAAWTLRPATIDDSTWMVELRAVVMRPDLERLGRYDETRVRQRFLSGYRPEHTSVIEVEGITAGLVALRPEPDERWLEHFYLAPEHQGAGLGTAVLARLLADDGDPRPFRLNVLQGSPARRLYERHGFTLEREDEVDVWMVRGSTAGDRHGARTFG
ncbi:GNAT family N-acetyltransferase [Plantibacter flavus]|uniref:GNAT family N-acetyltransferase n=1 Tax=Plantibacter flavus TaxID=150123 RepID=UPI0033958DDB